MPPRQPWLVWVLHGGLCVLSGGCTDLGTCDEGTARDVVFMHSLDPIRDGLPAYAGQALIQRSCGNGAFCHAEDAIDRFGTPAGLTLDIRLACLDPDRCDANERERLQRARGVVWRLAGDVLSQTESGAMPPGEAGAGVASVGPQFRRQPGRASAVSLLPAVSSEEGLEILKHWLACGAPVVGATMPESAEVTAGAPCPDAVPSVGECVVRAGTGAAP